ncbi:MAG: PA0069 family radical SAM protein [Planctomycetota bacterium]
MSDLEPKPQQPGEYVDALAQGPVRGRGAGINPANRFESIRLHVLGETLDERALESPCGGRVPTQILDDTTHTLINRVESPDLPFDWTINPYRGCEHGCVYCYARPGHEYLGMSAGLDFETRIMVKRDAPRVLRRELGRASWMGEPIVMAGVTDVYQPIERELEITRGCLKVMAECRQPVGIVTKNRMVVRDVDLLQELARCNAARVAISLTTLDNDLASKMEPRASSPAARLAAMRELAGAGVCVSVMTAPIIPGLNDHELPTLLKAARDAGATHAGWVLLRLPHQIKDVFIDWLGRHYPGRAAHVASLIRQTHDGELYRSDFHTRHRGSGPIAQRIASVFKVFAARHGLDRPCQRLESAGFRRPLEDGSGQMRLFG